MKNSYLIAFKAALSWNPGTFKLKSRFGMYLEPKDIAGVGLILAMGSRPSLLLNSLPALTVPEWLVKVIQHFITLLPPSPPTAMQGDFNQSGLCELLGAYQPHGL
jgi:hypothetical protein